MTAVTPMFCLDLIPIVFWASLRNVGALPVIHVCNGGPRDAVPLMQSNHRDAPEATTLRPFGVHDLVRRRYG